MTEMRPEEGIIDKILLIRGHKVMLDKDIAKFFDVETRKLKQAVRRNIQRFPENFMFELTENEIQDMVSQSVIPSKSYLGGAKPFVFTEHGLLMLANVLKSDQAIQMSIKIIEIFIKMRAVLQDNQLLEQRLIGIENNLSTHDQQFAEIWFEIKKLLALEVVENTQKTGFRFPHEDDE